MRHEVVWKAPTLGVGVLGLVVLVPVFGVAAVVGAWVMTSVVAADSMARIMTSLVGMGIALGIMQGLERRMKIQLAMAESPQPNLPSRWRVVIRGARPTGRQLGWGAVGLVVAAYFWFEFPGSMLFVVGSGGLGYVGASSLCWIPMVDRWQRATDQTVVTLRFPDGTRQHVPTPTAAEVDRILAGELGDHDRDWLVNVLASLHHGGWYAEAAALGDHLYARWGEPIDAYNAACSLARAGQHDLAVEYLGEALGGGFGRDLMATDPDLRPLLPRADVMELFRATAPSAGGAAGELTPPPRDALGDGLVEGGGIEAEDLADRS